MHKPLTEARAVLFDFDGTLADTAPDMAHALNRLLALHGQPPLPLARLRPMVSSGARGMVTEGFGIADTDARYPALRDAFLDLYHEAVMIDTTLFAGVEAMLTALERRGIVWGIVTNKSSRFVLPLVQALGLADRAGALICGNTTPHTKPHPEPLLAAAREVALAPADCIYVGDDIRDALAAEAAGMHFIAALYGYLGKEAEPARWPQSAAATSPAHLHALLAGEPQGVRGVYNSSAACAS